MIPSTQKENLKQDRKKGLKAKFGDPKYILESMADFLLDGDVASITDLIAAYVSNSKKYKTQESFAETIGTTRQTLHRMLAHNENVGIQVFFSAIEQIHKDSLNNKIIS